MLSTTTPSGLMINDTVAGTGQTAAAGQKVSVHYTGWLFFGGERGKKFDSSVDRGAPFEFSLGAGQAQRVLDDRAEGLALRARQGFGRPCKLGGKGDRLFDGRGHRYE